MATTNLSQYHSDTIPDAGKMRVGVVVSEWNADVTFALRDAALDTLRKHGVSPDDIKIRYVPGSFELTSGAQCLLEEGKIDAVIVLGCVIQGETPHFTFICQGITQGVTQLMIQYRCPVIFGVLTTLNRQQALDRSGGKYGNKGVEAAVTAIKMAALWKN